MSDSLVNGSFGANGDSVSGRVVPMASAIGSHWCHLNGTT